jgi:uncharacterized protein (DUF1499 family)
MKTLAALALVALSLLVAGRLGLLTGTRPSDLGAPGGRLKAPSATRNSVSSQASRYPDAPRTATIAPLACPGEPAAAMRRLAALLARMPGAVMITATPDYVHAEFTTRWLRFVDDVEFVAAPADGVIHVRSASRLGLEDLGANRRRVEAIRSAWEAENAIADHAPGEP